MVWWSIVLACALIHSANTHAHTFTCKVLCSMKPWPGVCQDVQRDLPVTLYLLQLPRLFDVNFGFVGLSSWKLFLYPQSIIFTLLSETSAHSSAIHSYPRCCTSWRLWLHSRLLLCFCLLLGSCCIYCLSAQQQHIPTTTQTHSSFLLSYLLLFFNLLSTPVCAYLGTQNPIHGSVVDHFSLVYAGDRH